jgi:hypothetical protein
MLRSEASAHESKGGEHMNIEVLSEPVEPQAAILKGA